MPQWPWFDRRGRSARLPVKVFAAATCIGASALTGACLPERELSSYAAGLPSVVSVTVSNPPEDEEADSGIVDVRAPPPVADAAPDAAEVDAGAVAILECRSECQCELRDGQDFMFCSTPVTQALAATQCREAGRALVSIEDAALNVWLSQRMGVVAEDNYWTAGTDTETEGVWRWGDGPVFYDTTGDAAVVTGFVVWDESQPNDLNGEDCLRAIGGLWRDLNCSEPLAYACEG
jgi:hypothetical protein